MAEPQPPSADEARASLNEVSDARRDAVEATRQPAWLHAIFAVMTGVGVGLATLREPRFQIAGVAIIVVGCVVIAVVQHHVTRRRGRILDEQSIRSQPLRFFVPYLVVFGLVMVQPDPSWQPWFALAAGVLVAVAGFVYLRWDERYQARRLAAGDYDPYDLV